MDLTLDLKIIVVKGGAFTYQENQTALFGAQDKLVLSNKQN
jgi:hypothetical protein